MYKGWEVSGAGPKSDQKSRRQSTGFPLSDPFLMEKRREEGSEKNNRGISQETFRNGLLTRAEEREGEEEGRLRVGFLFVPLKKNMERRGEN